MVRVYEVVGVAGVAGVVPVVRAVRVPIRKCHLMEEKKKKETK